MGDRERLALRCLAKMLREEYPTDKISEIVETWPAPDVTDAEVAAVRELDEEGAFDAVRRHGQ